MNDMAYLVQVDDVQLLAGNAMEQTTFLVQEDNFKGLKLLGQLASGNVGVDVQDLSGVRLGQTSEDGQRACTNSSFKRALVDASDLADEAVHVLIEIVRREHAGRDGACAGAELLEGIDEAKVLLEEDATGDLESFGV